MNDSDRHIGNHAMASGASQVPGRSLSESPAAAAFRGKIYVAHQGWGFNKELWYSTFDGVTWAPDRRMSYYTLSGSPALAEFGGLLHLVHKGGGSDKHLWWTWTRGTTDDTEPTWEAEKEVPGSTTVHSPALAAFNQTLYLVHHDNNDGGTLWYTTFDKSKWSGKVQEIKSLPNKAVGTPALAAFKGKLYLVYQPREDSSDSSSYLWCTTTSNGSDWSAAEKIGQTTGWGPASPALAVYKDTLYLAYRQRPSKDSPEGRLYYTTTADGTSWSTEKHHECPFVYNAPSLTQFNDALYWFETGQDYTLNAQVTT